MGDRTPADHVQAALEWGIQYTTTLPPEEASSVIQQVALRHGMVAKSVSKEKGCWLIQAEQVAPWDRVITGALPQRTTWVIRSEQGRTLITSDTTCFRWYLVFILALCAFTARVFLKGWFSFMALPALSNPLDLAGRFFMVVWTPLLLFLDFYFINFSGGKAMRLWMQELEREVEARGAFLKRHGRGASKRYNRRVFAFLSFAFSFLLVAMLTGSRSRQFWSHPLLAPAMIGLLSLIAILTLALVILHVHGSALTQRAIPMWPGLAGLGGLMFLVAPQLLWSIASDRVAEMAHLNQKIDVAIHTNSSTLSAAGQTPDLSTATQRYEAIRANTGFRLYAAAFILGFFGTIGIGFFLAVHSATRALAYWPWLLRLRRHADQDDVRTAIAGRGFLLLYRSLFTAVWLVFAFLMLGGVILALKSLFSIFAAYPFSVQPGMALSGAQTSVVLVSLAIGTSTAAIRLFSLSAWSLYVAICLMPFLLSLGEWFFTRSDRLQFLRKSAGNPPFDSAEWQRVLRLLSIKVGLAPPTLSIAPDFIPYARSLLLGWFNRRSFIEISSRCFRILDPAEIKALLAHELAHHALRHCARDNLIQFLGRITLVGDGFTRSLQDSFGYELAADRFAIKRLGADPKALKSCLRKLEKEHMEEQAPLTMISAFAAIGIPATDCERVFNEGPTALSRPARWRLAWQMFLEQYTGRRNTSYWHPAIQDRINALSALAT